MAAAFGLRSVGAGACVMAKKGLLRLSVAMASWSIDSTRSGRA